MEKSNNLNLCMPINSLGFGIHALTIIKALLLRSQMAAALRLKLIGDGAGLEHLCEEYGINFSELESIISGPPLRDDAPTLTLWHPHASNICKTGSRRVMLTHFETSMLTKEEVISLESVDHILVCSTWALRVLREHDITMCSMIPGACATTALADFTTATGTIFWPLDWFNKLEEKLLREHVFRIISVGKWEKRKGQETLVKALSQGKEMQGIELIAFWSNPFNGGLARARSFLVDQGWELSVKGWITEYSAYVDVWSKRDNTIILMPPIKSQRDLIKVISSGDAYISASSGEGWDQPLVEAMAAGVPCIATKNTAHLTYCTSQNSWGIDVNSELADDGQWFKGNKGQWYPCNIDAIEDTIIKFRACPPDEVKKIASQGTTFIRGYTNLKLVGNILNDVLHEYDDLQTMIKSQLELDEQASVSGS